MFYLVLGLIAVLLVVAQVGAYYYLHTSYGGTLSTSSAQCSSSNGSSTGTNVVQTNTLINYGNGTVRWYNETNIPATWNFYQLTLHLANGNVEAQCYGPPYNEHYVTGINNVNDRSPFYWTVWIFCQNQNAWSTSPVGVDLIRLSDGQTLAWAYEVPYHPPLPGARTIAFCS
jgi:hypothetical protein